MAAFATCLTGKLGRFWDFCLVSVPVTLTALEASVHGRLDHPYSLRSLDNLPQSHYLLFAMVSLVYGDFCFAGRRPPSQRTNSNTAVITDRTNTGRPRNKPLTFIGNATMALLCDIVFACDSFDPGC